MSFLTSQQMQQLIRVDRSTVYRMAEDGRLPGVKIGRQWRFPAGRVAEQLGLGDSSVTPLPGTADLGLEGLLRPEVAQSVAELIGELFGMMAVITDMDGEALTPVANPCGYYAAIAERRGDEACVSQWRVFAEEPHVAPRWVPTHLGFLCARTFVWVDFKPVGMIVVGGVTPPGWPPADEIVEAIADEVGVPRDVLLAAVDQTWDVDIDRRRRVIRLLPQMGDLVSHLASARNEIVNRLDAIVLLRAAAQQSTLEEGSRS